MPPKLSADYTTQESKAKNSKLSNKDLQNEIISLVPYMKIWRFKKLKSHFQIEWFMNLIYTVYLKWK